MRSNPTSKNRELGNLICPVDAVPMKPNDTILMYIVIFMMDNNRCYMAVSLRRFVNKNSCVQFSFVYIAFKTNFCLNIPLARNYVGEIALSFLLVFV